MLTKGVISSPSTKMFMMQNLWVESGCEPRKRRREEERLSQSNYVNTPIKEQGCREKARGRKAGGLDVDGGLEARPARGSGTAAGEGTGMCGGSYEK